MSDYSDRARGYSYEEESVEPDPVVQRNKGCESHAYCLHFERARRRSSQVRGMLKTVEDQELLWRHRSQVQRRPDRRLCSLPNARRLLCLL